MSHTLPHSTGPSSTSVVQDVFAKAKALIARQSEVMDLIAQANALLSKLPNLRAPIIDAHGNLRSDVDEMALRTARVKMGEVMDDANHVMEQATRMSEEWHVDSTAFMDWISDEKTWEGLDNDQVRRQFEIELQSFPRMNGAAALRVRQPTRDAVHDLIHSFDSLALSNLPSSSTSFPMDVCLIPPASIATSHEDTRTRAPTFPSPSHFLYHD